MMQERRFVVRPARTPLRGAVTVPGDKSIGHRAVIMASLAEGISGLSGLSMGLDNQKTVGVFRALGVSIEESGVGALTIAGVGPRGLRAPSMDLDCGNSGTSMRLLCGLLAAQPFASRLYGDEYLHRRPMGRVVLPLLQMGARISGTAGPGKDVYPPLAIEPPGDLRAIRYVSAIASAQVKSALLLCGLYAEGRTEVVEPMRSRDHTERMLRALGVEIETADLPEGACSVVHGVGAPGWPGFALHVPGDLSSAAFLLGAALLVPRSEVVISGVGVNPTRTGVLDAFEDLCPGAVERGEPSEVMGEPIADLRVRSAESALRPVRISGKLSLRSLDELPLLSALAGAAEGQSVITDARELRVKESDRIAATCAFLRAFGVDAEEQPEGLIIEGRGAAALRPAEVDSHGDHRIAMAATVLALMAPAPSRIHGVENVATSYPGFAATLRQLGADITIE